MYLTQKTERTMKKIEKTLNENGLNFEVIGNQILTDNCTIEILKGIISVNENEVEDVEDMLYEVLAVER